tara:strand:- start:1081 stop:2580 length:1500 start_codon:yes stop_codon:yes gene_type:complete
MDKFIIGEERLTISNIRNILFQNRKLLLSSNTKKIILDSRNFLNKKIQDSDVPVYGVNTGFGSLCNTKIADNDLESLQRNLVLSHACGIGDLVPKEIVKIMLLFKIEALIKGYSSVQLITVERLIEMFNNNIIPLVYQQGSLGASGDLAPLAHMSLFLIGEGQVYHNDKVQDSNIVLKEMNWQPIKLQSKEGLALLNGTQFMSAYGIWSIIKSQKLSYIADMIGAISLEGFDGRGECFDELIHLLRPHKGQLKTAANIRDFLQDSNIQKKVKKHVQDPYSFRCIPQVHGATKDVIDHVLGIFLTEVNSVTDNPNVFTKEDKIISGGNFHGQPLAMAMDYLAIAVAELGSISERRTYHLISGQRDLPSFLVANPGLNSGMMIPQYTAASIVSQNKQLCTPASVDSIVSSNGQEDHVSMGANAATKLLRVVENTERILAIELFNSSQAIFFRKEKSSDFIENILEIYREEVPVVKQDRLLYEDIDKSVSFLQNLSVDDNLI